MIRKLIYGLSIGVLSVGVLAGCGGTNVVGNNEEQEGTSTDKIEIKVGTCPGPYGDMFKEAIAPGLEEKGYKVTIVEFSDYVQPNIALAENEIDVNIFQHTVYFENFIEQHGLDLTKIITVPTAGLGFYSNTYTDISDVEKGATLAVPNDVTNLRRTLKEAQNAGLLTIDETVEANLFSEKNIIDNPLDLTIIPVEAAQLGRSIDTADLVAVLGNYALASGIDLDTALYTETLSDDMKNIIAARTSDIDSQFVKDIKEVVESEGFKEVIENSDDQFSAFQRPDWYVQKWQ